jgi:4-carboxymuconolactone decarboxylase
MSRIPDITSKDQLPQDKQHWWDEITASRGSVRGPFKVLLHSPEFAGRAAHVGTYVRFESPLEPRVRELTALITARLLDCNYEYSAHQPQAREHGVDDATLKAIDERRGADLPDDTRWLFELVEQLVVNHRIAPDTFKAAQDRLGVPGLVEVVGTVGYYSLLAMALNAFEVEPLS